MAKSRARSFLDKIAEQDGDMPMQDAPVDKGVVGSEEPIANDAVVKALGELMSQCENDPSVMAPCMDQVGDMLDRYMDEEDPCWTPGDDQKDTIVEANRAVRKAASLMKGMRK